MVEGNRTEGPCRILVVDDEQTVRKSIQKRLEKEGYSVVSVDNALDALKVFDWTPFDAVISDIRMNEMDGIELLKRIQAFHREVPVVMITGDPSLETAQNAVKEGAYDYITKPIEKEVLLQTIHRAVRTKKLSDQVKDYQRNLERRVEEQTRTIQSLFEFANLLNSMNSLEDVVRAVLHAVHRFTRCEKGIVLLFDRKKESLILFDSFGVEGFAEKLRIEAEDPFVKGAIERSTAFQMEEWLGPSASSPLGRLSERILGLPWLVVALKTTNAPLGLLVACQKQEGLEIEKEDLHILNYISDSASVAIQKQITDQRLKESYFNVLRALALAIEAKDPYTRGHSERVMRYSVGLAKKLHLTEEEIVTIGHAAILHDIGKIEVSKGIINKPDRLSLEEFRSMQDHPAIGEIMIENIPFLEEAKGAIRHHHERYDGHGYPDGLKGEGIPLGARIIAVADMFDALTTERPYRQDTSKERAILKLKEERGRHLDPRLVDAFIDSLLQEEGERW